MRDRSKIQAPPSTVRMPEHATGGKICVLGASLDVGNRGVLALGTSLARLLARARPGAEIVFHYGNRSGGSRRLGDIEVTVRNCRLSPRSAPSEHMVVILGLAALHRLGLRGPARRNPWLRSLLEAEFVGDIRGGDSFSDIYGLGRFLLGSLPLLSVALLARPYALLPQTYGPFRWRLSRALAAFMLRRASVIQTRDMNCVATVRDLCGRSPDFCPDVAFTLDPARPASLSVTPKNGIKLEDGDLLVGMNVSGLLYMGGYTGRNMFGLASDYQELVNRLIDRLLGSTRARILLVPHVLGEQEEEACSAILRVAGARHPGRVKVVSGSLSERELKWVIGQTGFFIGSRMHACIAALSQGIPTAGLAYSEKFLGVFQSAGIGGSIIDLRKADTSEVIEQTLTILAHREEIAQRLRSRIPTIRDEVNRALGKLLPQEPSVAVRRNPGSPPNRETVIG